MLIIILLFGSIILWQLKYMKGKQKYWNEPISYNNTIPIRGICAVEIMIGHIGGELTDEILLFPFRKAGILIVGVFFFLSGYGLMYSLMNREDYLKGFLRKRCKMILIPLVLVLGISMCVFFIENLMVIKFDWINLILYPLNSINWYVWEIIGCYFLFYLIFRIFKIQHALFLISVCGVVFVIVCYILNVSNPWYGSTLCFPFGLWIGKYENQFLCWCRKRIVLKNFILGVILGSSILVFFLLPERSIAGALISRNIASVTFVLLVLLVLQKIKIGNRISYKWGTISFEIFLVHPIVIHLYHSNFIYIENHILYTVMVCLTSLVLAISVKKGVNIINGDTKIHKRKIIVT